MNEDIETLYIVLLLLLYCNLFDENRTIMTKREICQTFLLTQSQTTRHIYRMNKRERGIQIPNFWLSNECVLLSIINNNKTNLKHTHKQEKNTNKTNKTIYY